jgi:hypothetical protein
VKQPSASTLKYNREPPSCFPLPPPTNHACTSFPALKALNESRSHGCPAFETDVTTSLFPPYPATLPLLLGPPHRRRSSDSSVRMSLWFLVRGSKEDLIDMYKALVLPRLVQL